jgi:hypothetical protein
MFDTAKPFTSQLSSREYENRFICPPVQRVQWDALVCRGATWSPMRKTGRNRSTRIRSLYQWLRIASDRSIQNLMSHIRMADKEQPQRFSFQKSSSIPVYTHYAMCQRGGY